METIFLGGPYHGTHGAEPPGGDGTHDVIGIHGTQRYFRFRILGNIALCRHESTSEEQAMQLAANLGR